MQQLVDDIDDSEHICDGAKEIYTMQIQRIVKEINGLVSMVNIGASNIANQPQVRMHEIRSAEDLEAVFRKIFGSGF